MKNRRGRKLRGRSEAVMQERERKKKEGKNGRRRITKQERPSVLELKGEEMRAEQLKAAANCNMSDFSPSKTSTLIHQKSQVLT